MHSVKSLLWHECAAIFEHLILCKHTHGSKSQDAGTKSQVKVKVWFWYLWMLLSNKSITTCGDDANKPCGSAVAKMPFGHVAMHSGPRRAVWHSSKSYSSKHHILYVKNSLTPSEPTRSNMTQKPQIKHGSRPGGSRKKPPVNMHYEHGRQTNLPAGDHTVLALCEQLEMLGWKHPWQLRQSQFLNKLNSMSVSVYHFLLADCQHTLISW